MLSHPHWLLTSLLLVNAACFEALPIFLDRLLNPVAAILISVSAILVFGEILPQAVCKRYGLQVGAYCAWLVRIVMWVTSPVSWPLSKCLDWLLGEETVLFRRAELRELVALHGEPEEDGGESMLTATEVQVIHGALDMAHKTAETAMTPLSNVFALDADDVLDRKLFEKIIAAGHSRIPVYTRGDKKNIIGLILVKELILVDQSRHMRVKDCLLRDVDFIVASTPLYTVMELFRLKRRHMAVLTQGEDEHQEGSVRGGQSGASVAAAAAEKLTQEIGHTTTTSTTNGGGGGEESTQKQETAGNKPLLPSPSKQTTTTALNHHIAGGGGAPLDVVGVITIEDVIEELLNVEILDETDKFYTMDGLETLPPPSSGKDLPPKLTKYLSMGKKAKIPSARPSPSKPVGAGAVVAAAAGAAYAAAKTSEKEKKAAKKRIQSETALNTVGGAEGAGGAGIEMDAGEQGALATTTTTTTNAKEKPKSPRNVRPQSSLV